MELPLSELFLLAAGIFGMATTAWIIRSRAGNSELNTKIKNRYNSYIADIEAENKKLKGALNRSKQPIRISEEVATGEPIAILSEIVESIPQLKPYRHLLKSKKAVEFVSNYVQQNPDAVKSIISKFTSKTANTGSGSGNDPEARGTL